MYGHYDNEFLSFRIIEAALSVLNNLKPVTLHVGLHVGTV